MVIWGNEYILWFWKNIVIVHKYCFIIIIQYIFSIEYIFKDYYCVIID